MKYVHPEDAKELKFKVDASIGQKKGIGLEYRIKRKDGTVINIFGYNEPIFDDSNNLISIFGTVQDITELKKLRAKWIQQKTPQPQKSAGCIFQNLTKEQQDNLDLPTQSIGYFIDQKLNLKGKIIGGAKISENHAEFIENIGDATSNDIHSLIKFIQNESEQKYKIKLALKVELAGKFK